MDLQTVKKKTKHFSPARILALGFLMIILIGALLLMLPIASNDGGVTPFWDALFTSVSATCVTGLIVVDTGVHWSMFGQAVIMLLIECGGLGFMSFGFIVIGSFLGHTSPRVRNLAAQSFGLDSAQGIWKFVTRIFIGTLLIELLGALILMTRTIPIAGIGKGIFYAFFLSISAFCNAGFDPFGGQYTTPFSSLTELGTDPVLLLTIAALIILGSLGFLVWNDVWERIKNKRKLSVYSRFVLSMSALVLALGTLLIALFEWNNMLTVGELPWWEKLIHIYFQAVTPRTAGFDAIGQAQMTDGTKTLTMILMFIGGASGSTAGGVKVNTLGVLLAAVFATLRGDKEIHLHRRSISTGTVMRAMCIVICVLTAVFAFALVISALDGVTMEESLFECFSAFCTVGLSLSLTPRLCLLSKILLMLAMYMGRVGILTLSAVLMTRKRNMDAISYPEAKIMIG